MKIFVRGFTGELDAIEVEPSRDTVDSLKAKYEEVTGIPFEQQLFLCGRSLLQDGHRLSEYNLVESCTMHMILQSLRCRYTYLPPVHIYVQTETLVSKTIVLQVDPSDTICDVRKQIGRHQSLFFADDDGSNYRKLSDDRTFGYFYRKIQNGSTLYLDFSIMQIFVKTPDGRTITLEVEPSDKIGDVKAKIRDQLRIILDGNEISDEQSMIGSYDIHNDSTLHLDLCRHRPHGGSMRIAVKTLASTSRSDATAIKFKVLVSGKIGDVKAKILNQQRLVFNGQQLVDGHTLANCGVQNESTLHLRCPMHVSVETFAGETITLEVDPSNTIGDVKDMVVGDHQSLSFDGNELVDDGKKTLAEYGVHMGSTLHLDAVTTRKKQKMVSTEDVGAPGAVSEELPQVSGKRRRETRPNKKFIGPEWK